ncbi:aspartic proteinase nepenthesin-2-like [Phalaenopsis equestris]|uniref:aspartic proteinase nepenthesin-2-like n=1 Tax=Phalaenopsis equestris TaxID=78828 RepID=UPI0009E2EEE2|nr:aspartic proteinase nepenthesin-2-like [Phalaenopsis equestris]
MDGFSLFIFSILLFGACEMVKCSEIPPWAFRGGSSSAPIVLPLALSSSNHTLRSAEESHLRRRGLRDGDRSTHNARMPLFDDLLTNGYYTTRLYIGTPPQEFALIVDSGSTVTYVPCSTCVQCGNHQDPRFRPEHSSTYEPVKCNIDCTCDKKKMQCTYERQYAEMSSSSGLLAQEIISFGKESELLPQRAIFGCENSESGDLFNQNADGIMGLGRGQLSIIDQLVKKGAISDSFSLCYGGMDVGGGAMVLGGIPPPPGMVFSHSDPARSPYYNIELKEIHVGGESLRLNPRVFDSKHGTVLDSGTTYAYLPQEAFRAFKDVLGSKLGSLKKVDGPDPTYKDICFAGAGRDPSKSFPEVDMVFGNGKMLKLAPENYLFRHSKIDGAYCLGIFQNGNDPTTLLGGIIVRNTLVTYDRHNRRIGFWKTNCSDLWDRLNIDKKETEKQKPPPAPTSKNLTIELAPALSPSESKDNFLPGQIQIGIITFDMYLNLTYSALQPHWKELEELIAHDLDVMSYQVHLMKLTIKGNGTLIKLAIFPADTSDFISNTTAMGIIARLTEHRFRLPETFGSYEVVHWNFEPPSRRSWRQRHLWAVGLGISVVVMLSFTTFLIWYLWRHKSAALQAAYRPVDAAVPEQEMQPL